MEDRNHASYGEASSIKLGTDKLEETDWLGSAAIDGAIRFRTEITEQ